jgi:hypothetical protein
MLKADGIADNAERHGVTFLLPSFMGLFRRHYGF